MVQSTRNTKKALLEATMGQVAAGGLESLTINAIARRTGVTEGAIYRHYRGKEDLRWQAFAQTVEDMAGEKQALVAADLSFREKVRQWVWLTFDYYDRRPDAFTYVLLTAHPQPAGEADREITTRQGRLFKEVFVRACACGEVREMEPALALCHLTGLMLNVPEMINSGALEGPASDYVDRVAEAVCRVLCPGGEELL